MDIHKKEVCPFRQAFFSLTSNYMESVYENIMILIWKAGWNYSNLYNMPINKRNWMFEKFEALIRQESEAIEEKVDG